MTLFRSMTRLVLASVAALLFVVPGCGSQDVDVATPVKRDEVTKGTAVDDRATDETVKRVVGTDAPRIEVLPSADPVSIEQPSVAPPEVATPKIDRDAVLTKLDAAIAKEVALAKEPTFAEEGDQGRRRVAIELMRECVESGKEKLDLNSKGLTVLPLEIGLLTNLTTLNVSSNALTSLPREVGLLKNLTSLNVSGNEFGHYPPELGLLANLRVLKINCNAFAELSPEIGLLKKLEELDVSGNAFVTLPSEIGNLTNLRVLYLKGNKLKTLPPEVGNLSKILHSWKSFTAHALNDLLARQGRVWQDESFNHIVRSVEHLNYYRAYICKNPSKARLRAGYELGCGSGLMT